MDITSTEDFQFFIKQDLTIQSPLLPQCPLVHHCTVGDDVQLAILGQKPSWAHLLVAPARTVRHRQVTLYKGPRYYWLKIFVTSSVLKLQKWFLHQNGVESNQKSKSDMYKLLSGAKRCVSYQKMCSRWFLAWYCHLAWLDIVANCALVFQFHIYLSWVIEMSPVLSPLPVAVDF